MPSTTASNAPIDLSRAAHVLYNPSVEELVEHALREDGAVMASNEAIVCKSGKYTGRTPKDKHVVREPGSEANIWWENNNPMDQATFEHIRGRLHHYAEGKRLYVIDTFGGADPAYRIRARFIVERPYHALFIKQLLIRPTADELAAYEPDWTIADMGRLKMDPATDGTKGDAVIALHLGEKQVLIAGTEYAGEMKKSVFTIMNYLLPLGGALSMHCSANIGPSGDTALFFGLSGTGKTTLSADPDRRLIGDDEHGWSDQGVFNVEGGCYAKCIKLSPEGEPEIWQAIRYGAVLENVVLDDRGNPDYDDAGITENTRAAYPIEYISNAVIPSVGGHPKNIVFLTADAFGILPPISRLTREQAMYHFLSGYTAKVAGTEAGVTEPQPTFSTCFGAPFLPLRPKVYADLLGEKIDRHGVKVWLINTGWTGGPYGSGSRMKLSYTRAMLTAALQGDLDGVEYETMPLFDLAMPVSCPDVPSQVLNPRNTWPDKAAYDAKARVLFEMFEKNIQKFA
ncbi:MAG TPA: phosphoenolpyruvate carboxykinase (ATP) [Fimbriimonadaceae bacterium]|nr:phosphoenolpyruvate carboxykinase (ATP) [Fimbriimonadaceae bacterium]